MSDQAAFAATQLRLLKLSEMPCRDAEFICETCRKIDFQDLLKNPRQAQHPWETTETSLHTMQYSDGCKLCLLMFQDIPARYNTEKTFELRSFSFKQMSSRAEETNLDASDSVLLKIGLQRPGGFLDYPPDDVFCKLASDNSQGPYCAQPVQRIWDCAKARLWLNTCMECHESVCKQDFVRVPGMHLIDCEDLVVVKATQGMRWLALSYVWGVNLQIENHPGYHEGSSVSSNIPATVLDAVSVTLQLGYRHLWVDEYCIEQDNEVRRNDQIKRMDQIYRGADLTIVAAAGESKMYGLPGVGSAKRKDSKVICIEDVVVFSNGPEPNVEAQQSRWFTRAWTFQEGLLSKRMLIFTEHQVSFYCSVTSWIEGLGNPDSNASLQVDSDYLSVNRVFGTTNVLTSPLRNWNHLASILEKYSKRQITKEADTLDAILGVMNHIRWLRPVQFLRGLPFFKVPGETSENTLMESFEEVLTAALSWNSCEDEVNSPRRQPTFPSWTWAGWSEEAEFWIRQVRETRHRSFLLHARLESISGEIIASSTLWKDDIQHELDTVTLIQFEAPIVPAASFSIIEDQSLDTESDVSSVMEGFNFRVAGRPLCRNRYPDIYTLDKLFENVRKGIWSCFMLCAGRNNLEDDEEAYSNFVLVVRWEADQVTAERIGSFELYSGPSVDAEFGPIREESWPWRCVRLI